MASILNSLRSLLKFSATVLSLQVLDPVMSGSPGSRAAMNERGAVIVGVVSGSRSPPTGAAKSRGQTSSSEGDRGDRAA